MRRSWCRGLELFSSQLCGAMARAGIITFRENRSLCRIMTSKVPRGREWAIGESGTDACLWWGWSLASPAGCSEHLETRICPRLQGRPSARGRNLDRDGAPTKAFEPSRYVWAVGYADGDSIAIKNPSTAGR